MSYRMGIIQIFDSLSASLNWTGLTQQIGRALLISSLQKATEEQAKNYLEELHKITSDVLCMKMR